jgi:hypothetical protein
MNGRAPFTELIPVAVNPGNNCLPLPKVIENTVHCRAHFFFPGRELCGSQSNLPLGQIVLTAVGVGTGSKVGDRIVAWYKFTFSHSGSPEKTLKRTSAGVSDANTPS